MSYIKSSKSIKEYIYRKLIIHETVDEFRKNVLERKAWNTIRLYIYKKEQLAHKIRRADTFFNAMRIRRIENRKLFYIRNNLHINYQVYIYIYIYI